MIIYLNSFSLPFSCPYWSILDTCQDTHGITRFRTYYNEHFIFSSKTLKDNLVLLLFSLSVMSNSLWPHGLQHSRLPCPSPSPSSAQFSSVAQLCPTATSCTVAHQASLSITSSRFAQTHVLWVGDAIQPSHPLSTPFPPTFNLFQYHSLFQWVSSLHQVAKALELQLQQ